MKSMWYSQIFIILFTVIEAEVSYSLIFSTNSVNVTNFPDKLVGDANLFDG
jgi:hypothetical protein